jgi:hypothetical protein
MGNTSQRQKEGAFSRDVEEVIVPRYYKLRLTAFGAPTEQFLQGFSN